MFKFEEILCCPEDKGDLEAIENKLLKCKICQHEYPVVNGIPRLLSGPYYNESWDEKWVKYDGGVGYNFRIIDETDMAYKIHNIIKFFEEKEQFLNSVKDSVVTLDVGCGVGQYAVRLLQLGAPFVIALDLSSGAVETGKKIIKDKFPELSDRIMFVQADASFLPFKDNTFCVSQALASIHHSGRLDECVSELARVTKKEGILTAWIYARPFFEKGDKCRESFLSLLGSFFKNSILILGSFRRDLVHIVLRRMPKIILHNILCFMASDLVFSLRKLVARFYYRHIFCYPDKGYRLINLYDAYSPMYAEVSSEADIVRWSVENKFKTIDTVDHRLGFIARKEP